MESKLKCPITVVTGFLGSGKTTLLRKIFSKNDMEGTAVLVNEFGKVGLDHSLLKRVDERTVLLGGGCVCCNMRDDLVKELRNLLNSYQREELEQLDRVVIETTGLADPAPILFTIMADPVLIHHFYIEQVVTTVDAVNCEFHLENHIESIKQIAASDKIVLTKLDLIEPKSIAKLKAMLGDINPSAIIFEVVNGEINSEEFFNNDNDNDIVHRYNIQHQHSDAEIKSSSQHVSNVRSIAITFKEPLDWIAFGIWMSMLLFSRGEDVLRVKGLIDVGEGGPVVLNGVQHIIHPPQHLEDWNNDDRISKFRTLDITYENK